MNPLRMAGRVAALMLPLMLPFNALAQSPWLGDESCEAIFERLPDRLPGGARLESFSDMDRFHVYRLPGGGTLRIDGPEVVRETVTGDGFAAAQSDLFDRAPFGLRGRHGPGVGVVLAQVESIYNGEVSVTGSPLGFAAEAGSAELHIAPVVHLADWSGYAFASPEDQALWDKALCSQAHHELGHILVAAQVMTEAEASLTQVANPTQTGISLAIRTALESMMSDIRQRQDLYHAEIKLLGWQVADSRPYVELPFSWLGGDALDGVMEGGSGR